MDKEALKELSKKVADQIKVKCKVACPCGNVIEPHINDLLLSYIELFLNEAWMNGYSKGMDKAVHLFEDWRK